MPQLPIHEIENDLIATLRSGNRLVLTAPTGSGKTTQVPQILHRAAVSPGKIIILQPRRLATRLVANRVAAEMKVRVGDLVGYQTRHDNRVTHHTLIHFMTEGLFLRLLQSDPTLQGIGTVILDEFHERSLNADVSLGVLKALQETRRPDLRVVVMSATLDAQRVAAFLACPNLAAGGRLHPVQVTYLEKRSFIQPWDLAHDALDHLLHTQPEGDILIFMPGSYEIRRTLDACRRLDRDDTLAFFPLHGELPPAQQDAAVGPCDRRKVIVSTNVAETSITIEGVRHVIDSGQAKINRYDTRRGINVLLVEPISRASAEQRAGRAGRTAPGTVTRLWTEPEHRTRPEHETPEARRLDLAEVVLQLKSFGVVDPANFAWLEKPEPAALQQALGVLAMIGAVTPGGALTDMGRIMARLPMHPRLSRMLIEARRRGCLRRAALWAALISERGILVRRRENTFNDEPQREAATDFVVLERAFETARNVEFEPTRCEKLGVHAMACRELDRTHRLYLDVCGDVFDSRSRGGAEASINASDVVKCLLVAFPDHLATRRSEGNLACAIVGQRRGVLDETTIAKRVGPVLPVEVREVGAGQGVKTVLSLVSEVEPAWVEEMFPGRVVRDVAVTWNADIKGTVRAERVLFDDLVLSESPRGEPDPAAAGPILAEMAFHNELKLNGWDEAVDQWIARTRWVGQNFPERKLITYDDQDRRVLLQEICSGATRYSQIADKPCIDIVRNALSWDDQQFVERMAPDRVQLPRGFKMKIDYTPGSPPRGRAKIQDFYEMNQSPTVAGGRQRVLLEILGPNQRPLQITDDLAGFWANLYPTLRKELSRKYPRHEWR
ncbi:MAG: ATP-dependent helicase HrpB [Planctomycetes bacterium]|nr:ATP-dependent helicase HrpB [Planctomycetota bacterium]